MEQQLEQSLDELNVSIEHCVNQLRRARQERDEALARMVVLLKQIGAADHCNGCNRPILWVRHRNGVAAPYDSDGTPHFATCPKADQFRRKKETKRA